MIISPNTAFLTYNCQRLVSILLLCMQTLLNLGQAFFHHASLSLYYFNNHNYDFSSLAMLHSESQFPRPHYHESSSMTQKAQKKRNPSSYTH